MSHNNENKSNRPQEPFFKRLHDSFRYYGVLSQVVDETRLCRDSATNDGLWRIATTQIEAMSGQLADELWSAFYIDDLEPRDHVDELHQTLPGEEGALRAATGKVLAASDVTEAPTLYQSLLHARAWRSQMERLRGHHRDEMEAYVLHCAEMEGMSRREALLSAQQSVTLQLQQDDWGIIYLGHRESLPQMLGVMRFHSGDRSGAVLDKMMHLAAQLEWVEEELARVEDTPYVGANVGANVGGTSFEEYIPEYLREGRLFEAWEKLVEAGYLTQDKRLAPTTKKVAAQYIVRCFCANRENNEWLPFEKLWEMDRLRFNLGEPKKADKEKIDKIFTFCN